MTIFQESVQELYELDEFMSENNSVIQKPRSIKHKTPSQKNVLLVDDSLRSIAPLNLVFRQLGCNTILSFNCISAKDEILKQHFDLIVLDWTLPDGTGGDTLLKAQQTFDKITSRWRPTDFNNDKTPVVIYSGTSSLRMDIPTCKNFDIVDFWLKPLDNSAIVKRAIATLKR